MVAVLITVAGLVLALSDNDAIRDVRLGWALVIVGIALGLMSHGESTTEKQLRFRIYQLEKEKEEHGDE